MQIGELELARWVQAPYDIQPDDPDAQYVYGRILTGDERFQKIRVPWRGRGEKWLRSGPNDRTRFSVGMGLRRGHDDEAQQQSPELQLDLEQDSAITWHAR